MQNDHTEATRTDEIDLLQLCCTLWAGKWLIVSCTVLAMLLAGAYAFFVAQPRYVSSVHLNAPVASSLDGLNRGREAAGLEPYTPKKAYEFFALSLTSDSTFQQFVRRVLSYPEDVPLSASLLEQNAWRLNIAVPDPRGRNLYRVTASAHTPEQAQQHLALFLGIAQAQAMSALLDDASNEVAIRIDGIESTLAAQRAIALQQRQDRIVRLREALAVAEAIGQDSPQINLARPSSPESLKDYLEGKELYARGVRALKAELDVLESRENDDAFIDDLRKNEARLKLLRAISPQTDSLLLYRLDGAVLTPVVPVEPRKALILALAMAIGGVLGVFWVLVRNMVRTQRRPG